MAKQKTLPTEQSIDEFLNKIPDKLVRQDCIGISKLISGLTGYNPQMWGPSIIGFGKYHYKYASGHEGDCCLTGFSPRKNNITLYVLAGFPGQEELLKKIGRHKAGKGCLYINKLEDLNIEILKLLVVQSVQFLRKKYPDQQEPISRQLVNK